MKNISRRSALSIFFSTVSGVNKRKLFNLGLSYQFIKGVINHPLRTLNSTVGTHLLQVTLS